MSDAQGEFRNMDVSMISRRKELEAENACLKKIYAKERLKAEIVQDSL